MSGLPLWNNRLIDDAVKSGLRQRLDRWLVSNLFISMKESRKHPNLADLSVRINIGFLLLLIAFLLIWVVAS